MWFNFGDNTDFKNIFSIPFSFIDKKQNNSQDLKYWSFIDPEDIDNMISKAKLIELEQKQDWFNKCIEIYQNVLIRDPDDYLSNFSIGKLIKYVFSDKNLCILDSWKLLLRILDILDPHIMFF